MFAQIKIRILRISRMRNFDHNILIYSQTYIARACSSGVLLNNAASNHFATLICKSLFPSLFTTKVFFQAHRNISKYKYNLKLTNVQV